MEIERMTAAVRPRGGWEAIDLGCVMARHWFVPLWSLWMVVAIPVFVIATVAFPDSPGVVFLIVWWFKPLFEPALLYWLSRALFADRQHRLDVLRRFHKIVWPGVVADLSYRRLSPYRSLYMPVTVLEGQRGKLRAERVAVLGRDPTPAAISTIIMFHLEMVLAASVLFTFILIIPDELDWPLLWNLLSIDETQGQWFYMVLYFLAMSVMAPFYSGSGFALYLTRRTLLEAWDIEISFHRLREVFRRKGAAAVLVVFSVFIPSAFTPNIAMASELDFSKAHKVIEEIKAGNDFGETQTRTDWQLIRDSDPESDPEVERDREWLNNIGRTLGAMLKPLAWLFVVVILAWLVYLLVAGQPHWAVSKFLNRRPKREPVPVELFGLSMSAETLPSDPSAVASALLDKGEFRGAISILYRGALVAVLNRHEVVIPSSATEQECQRLVGNARPEAESQYFARLTHTWLELAYGHLPPEILPARNLCSDWREHYGS